MVANRLENRGDFVNAESILNVMKNPCQLISVTPVKSTVKTLMVAKWHSQYLPFSHSVGATRL